MRKRGAEEPLEGERSRRGARPPTSPLGKSSPPKPPGETSFLTCLLRIDCVLPSGRGWCGGWESLLLSVGGEETYRQDIWEGSYV